MHRKISAAQLVSFPENTGGAVSEREKEIKECDDLDSDGDEKVPHKNHKVPWKTKGISRISEESYK